MAEPSFSIEHRALFEAIKSGDMDYIIPYTQSHSIDINICNDNGETPLLYAMRYAPKDMKQKIVTIISTAPYTLVDISDNNQTTPLHEAIKQDNPDIMLTLLYKYADIHFKNSNNESALDMISNNNCPNINQMIQNNTPEWLESIADHKVLLSLREAVTEPIQSAETEIKQNSDSIAKYRKHRINLIKANKNKQNKKNQDIIANAYELFIETYKDACKRMFGTKLIKGLIEESTFDIHENHEFLLRWAARYGQNRTVEYLLDHGADVHAVNDDALFVAIGNRYLETANLLLDRGANPLARGEKPFKSLLNNVVNSPAIKKSKLAKRLQKINSDLEARKRPFSNELKPSLMESFLYHTSLKSALETDDVNSYIKSFMQSCKKDYPWCAHQILKSVELDKNLIDKGFEHAACRKKHKPNPNVIHVLLEHGLDAQKAMNKYYNDGYKSSLIRKGDSKTVLDSVRNTVEILEHFGGSSAISRLNQINHTKAQSRNRKPNN